METIILILRGRISNVYYLTGLRASLEAALMTAKRLKPRSDIEAAMIVVNLRSTEAAKDQTACAQALRYSDEGRRQRLKLLY